MPKFPHQIKQQRRRHSVAPMSKSPNSVTDQLTTSGVKDNDPTQHVYFEVSKTFSELAFKKGFITFCWNGFIYFSFVSLQQNGAVIFLIESKLTYCML